MIYNYETCNGYLIIDDHNSGKHLLLDTGCPFSFADEPLSFEGTLIRQDEFLGCSGKTLSGYIETRIDGLVGMNIIGKHNSVIIDPMEKTVHFSIQDLDMRQDVYLYSSSGTRILSPWVKVTIGGRPVRMLFDTGAPLSYIDKNIVPDEAETIGIHRDFYPFEPDNGKFEVEAWKFPVLLGDRTGFPFLLEAAELPECLKHLKGHGILGTILLREYRIGLMRGDLVLDRLTTHSPITASNRAV